MTGTLVRTSPKRTLYVRALFDYDPAKGGRGITVVENCLVAFHSILEIVSFEFVVVSCHCQFAVILKTFFLGCIVEAVEG